MRPFSVIFPRLVAAIGVSVALAAEPASAQTITFDTFPNGAAVPNGTVITDQYASLGVTFSSPAPAGGPTAGVFANEATSKPNCLVGIDPSTQAGLSPITMTFAAPFPDAVSVTLISVGNATFKATAFGSDSRELHAIFRTRGPGAGNGFGNADPITLQGPGIARVVFEISQAGAVLDGFGIDDVSWSAPTTRVPLLRYYNGDPFIVDHFYTAAFSENQCGRGGWFYEGTIGFLLAAPAANTAPLYRYWNPAIGDHFYTTDPSEVQAGGGYVGEGITGHLLTAQQPGTVPLFRLWDPNGLDHLYTTDANEAASLGQVFVAEGVTGYVFAAGAGDQQNCPLVDLRVTKVRPVQVVYDVDLVRGKSTAFEVTIHADECRQLGSVEVQVALDAEVLPGERLSVNDFDFACNATLHLRSTATPDTAGTARVTARVDPNGWIREQFEGNNALDEAVHVRTTHALPILYVPVANCTGGRSRVFTETVLEGGDFVDTLFPIAEGAHTAVVSTIPFTGSVCSQLVPPNFAKVALSLMRLGRYGKRLRPDVKKVIGVADQFSNWFLEQYGQILGGVTFPYFTAGVVQDGQAIAPAHELGHMFGLWTFTGEEYDALPPGRVADGYWVAEGRPITGATCFMGRPEPPLFVSALGGTSPPIASERVWIDQPDYRELLDTFSANPADPDALLVSGLLHRNGAFDLEGLDLLHNATVDSDTVLDVAAVPAGTSKQMTIRVLGDDGTLLASLTHTTLFTPIEGSATEPDVAPVVLALPYPESAAAIEIAVEGTVVHRSDGRSSLLRDAISSIPEEGFRGHPSLDRRLLLGLVDLFERALQKGKTKLAALLLLDLRLAVRLFVKSTYAIEDQLQLTRDQVLTLIADVQSRLGLAPPR